MNKHYVHSRVGTLNRRHLAIAAAAIALGLTSCHDDSTPNLPPIIPVPNSIVVKDVGNGALDLLVATTADEGAALNPGYADVIMNTPGSLGTFKTGVHYSTTGTNPSSIAAADLTGSGGLDLVIANFGNGSVSVFLHGATPGTFNAAVDVATGGQPNQVVASQLAGMGKGGFALVLADMSSSGNVIVLPPDPANPGKFLAPMKLPTGLTTPSVAVGDLTAANGSGPPAIVAATFDSAGNSGAVQIFWPDPKNPGMFLAPVSFPAGAQPQSVKIADVNGDGLPDLIVADFGPGADGMGSAGVSVL
ncbi:MAG TPA: VCBS repeat-containing protein, partial [Steroidobacteraceae bacterium]